MTLFAAIGATLLALGCSPQAQQAPSALSAPAFPDIVALAETDPAAAIDALDARAGGTATVESSVLRARLLAATGRHDESASAWMETASAEPALRDYASRAAVGAHIAAGAVDRALAALAPLLSGESPQAHTDLALDVATALRVARRHDEARALYRRVLEIRDSGSRAEQARLGLAESLASTGDTDVALGELRRVRLTFGNYDAYDAARRAETRIARAADRAVPPLSADDYATMTGRLLARSRYDEAVRLFEEQLQIADRSDAARLSAAIIDTLYRARENREALSRIRDFRRRWPRSTFDDELTVLEFRIAIREARTADVRRLGTRIMRGGVPGVSTGEARGIGRLVGSYMVAVGRVAEGLAVFRELFQSSRARDEQEDLLWRAGIAAVRAGEFDRAESNLQALIDRRVGPETTRIARFWLADVAARRGRTEEARRIWTEIADEHPLDYYGLRAAARLGRAPRVDGTLPRPDLAARPESLASPEMRAARILSAAGLTADAAALAREAAERFADDSGLAYEAARASAAVGEYRAAHSLMARRFPAYITRGGQDLPPDFLKLFWPMAFEEHITAAGDRANVDPHVMLSIARRESRFDPSVRSVVGAVGLFQFMPYTANELATPAGLDSVDEDALKTPHASARLAATYLKGLLDQFDGELAPAAAAYNAGEDLVTYWWKAHKAAGVDLFVEMIPYSETRGYVREVVGNFGAYKAIYGN